MVDSVKNYGIAGVGANVQLGKGGPVIVGSDAEQVSMEDAQGGAAVVEVAAGTEPEHAVALSQLGDATDAKVSFLAKTLNFDDGTVLLGTAQPGVKVFSISLTPGTAWTGADGSTELQIGTQANPELLLHFDDFEAFDTQVVTDVGISFSEQTAISAVVSKGAAITGTVEVVIKHIGTIQ